MDEYVSKKALLKAVEEDFNRDWGERGANGDWDYIDGARDEYDDVIDIICQMPAADVQPVKRGKWDFQGYQLFMCTNCKKIYTQEQLEDIGEEWTFPNFCPNCGAKMIKDGDTE